MRKFQIGQVEFIWNNGAGSIIFHAENHEYMLNIKPTPGQAQELLVQFFIMKKPENVRDGEQTSVV